MNLDEFIAYVPELWDGDAATADVPRDRRFRDLLADTGGMGTENKLALLNLAAAHLGEGEIYLEVGAFRGTSIVAAAMGHDEKQFVTVDNFSEFGGPKEDCLAAIERHTSGNVTLHDRDAWDVLRHPPFKEPVGVFFYDGPHEYWHQWKALDLIQPLLADEALVIVDDASWPFVRAADDAFVATHPRFECVARYRVTGNSDARWWNGVDVIAFRRRLAPADEGVVTRAYLRGLLLWGLGFRGLDRAKASVVGAMRGAARLAGIRRQPSR